MPRPYPATPRVALHLEAMPRANIPGMFKLRRRIKNC